MDNGLQYQSAKPTSQLSHFVESFWMLQNTSDSSIDVVKLPDGRIDLLFALSAETGFQITLLGLETSSKESSIAPAMRIFAISFNPVAIEYIFQTSTAHLLNKGQLLPVGFWDMGIADLDDFERFCKTASDKIQTLLTKKTDERKLHLFALLFAAKGSITVKEVAKKTFWQSRQINRYFNQQYGISVKSYCGILRFRASFQHIKKGKLNPHQNFTDRSHFIREVKRLSGVLPKELKQNKNDRFVHFSVLPEK